MAKKTERERDRLALIKATRDVSKQRLKYADFKIICQLHAKYFDHKLYYPNWCSCNSKEIHKYIEEISECLI